MGLADKIRIMRGHLTPEETAERDAAARRRREAADREVQRQAAAAQRAANSDAAETAYRETYLRRVERAGAISSVELVCHSDTWRSIEHETRHAVHEFSGFKDRKELGEGRYSIRVSGRELACILEKTAMVGNPAHAETSWRSAADRAVALQVYRAVGRIVDQADPDADPSRALPPIVIDAGAARRDDEDQGQDQPDGTPAPRA